jgi:hypothetical protein
MRRSGVLAGKSAPPFVGLATTAGFSLAFAITALE